MMSRTLSIKLAKDEVIRKMWLFILTLIILIILKPSGILMRIDEILMWSNGSLTKYDVVNQLAYTINFSNQYNRIIVIVAGVIYAFISFGYLYSKSQVDLYHSLSIKRKDLFWAFSLSKVVPFVVIELIITGINILILFIKGIACPFGISVLLNTCLLEIVFFLLVYNITALAIMITGNRLVGGIGTAFFIFAGSAVFEVYTSYKAYCFETYTYLSDEFSWIKFVLSPLDAMSNVKNRITDSESFLMVAVLCIEVIILMILNQYLYKKRPSECTATALCYPVLRPIIKIPTVIYAALMGGIYVVYVANSLSVTWYWVAFFAVGIVANFIINSLLYSDYKKCMASPVQLFVAYAIAAVIALCFIYDVTGYDKYIPDESKVEYASVNLGSIHEEISNYELVEQAGGFSYEYTDLNKYRLDHMKTQNVATAIEFANIGVSEMDNSMSVFERDEQRREDNNNEYEPQPEENSVIIKYHLKSGRDVYRVYSLDMDKSYAATEKIYNSPEYKDSVLQLVEYSKVNDFGIISGSNVFGTKEFELAGEQVTGFIYALEADYRNLTLNQLANEYPIMSLSSYDPINYSDIIYGYYIYPSFDNTISYLESLGIKVDKENPKFDIERIKSIHIERYDYNTAEEWVGKDYEAGTDDDVIKKITDVMIYDTFTYTNSVLKDYEQNLDITCNYISDDGFLNSFMVRVPRGTMDGIDF